MKLKGDSLSIAFIPLFLLLLTAGCGKAGKEVHSLEAEADSLYKKGQYDSSFVFYFEYVDSLRTARSPLLPEKILETGKLFILHAKYGLFDRIFANQPEFNKLSQKAEFLRLNGERYLLTDNPQRAEKYFQTANELRMKSNDSAALAQAANDLADVNLAMNKFPECKSWLDECSKILDIIKNEEIERAENLLSMGNYYYRLGNFSGALNSFQSSLKLYDSLKIQEGKAKALNNVGNSYFRLYNVEKALDCFNEALKIRREIFGENHPGTADTYNNLGLIYDYFGEPDRAIDYYAKALSVREKIFGNNSRVTGKTLTNYANALKDFGDYARAESLYIKSVSIFENYNVNDPDIAIICINLGEVLAVQNNLTDAIRYLKRAVQLLTDNYGANHIWTAMAKLNLSVSCWSAGHSKEAEEYLNSSYNAIKSSREAGPVLAEILTEYGFREFSEGEYSKALMHYQEALKELVPGFTSKDYTLNPDSKIIPNDKRIIRILTYKAEGLAAVDNKNLSAAYNCLKLAQTVIDNIRLGFKEESSGILLGKEVRETYSAAADILYSIYEKNPDEKIINEVFRIFEKSKSAVLLSKKVDIKAKDAAGIPDSLLERERSLKMKITAINVSGEEEEKDQLLSLKQEYLDLINIYQDKFPLYYGLKFNTDVVTLPEMRKTQLQEGETCIHYLLTDKNVYALVITKDNSDFIKLPGGIKIQETVEAYRKGMIESNYEMFSNAAYQLFSILIKPIEQWIRGESLIIVPDGILNLAAFDTFIDSVPVNGQGDYKKLNYLIYKYRISYTYSCSLLMENLTYKSPGELNATLGFAPY